MLRAGSAARSRRCCTPGRTCAGSGPCSSTTRATAGPGGTTTPMATAPGCRGVACSTPGTTGWATAFRRSTSARTRSSSGAPIRAGWPPSTISRSTSASSTARTSPPSRRTAPGGDRIRSRRSAKSWARTGRLTDRSRPRCRRSRLRTGPAWNPGPLPARRRSATSSPAWSTRTRSASSTWSATSATSTRTRRCCCTTEVRIRISSTASSRPIATGPCCILRRVRCVGDGCTTSRWTACDSPWCISRSIRSRSSIPTSSRCGRDTRTGWRPCWRRSGGWGS